MKYKIIYIACLLFAVALTGQAQKENSWWIFGERNGLNFNNTSSVNDNLGTLTAGIPEAIEGKIATVSNSASVMSDADGNLLLYTDGVTLWDRTHSVVTLAGGAFLGGQGQASIIVPVPGTTNRFYVICAEGNNNTVTGNGITYSYITVNVQTGAVSSPREQRNQVLMADQSDRNITAVKKTGSDNYWIIHRRIPSTTGICTVYVWELSSAGFTGPVTYTFNTGLTHTYLNYLNNGYLKFSSDGTKFAGGIGNDTGTYFLSGEFDPATGQVSGLQCRALVPNGYRRSWTSEFSLSGEHLFATSQGIDEPLLHITWDALRTTQVPATVLDKPVTSVQMHSDGRIYGTNRTTKDLYVIMNPEAGAAAVIRVFPDHLPGPAGLDLPNFVANYAKADYIYSSCANTAIDFSLFVNSSTAYSIWNFGDGTAEVRNNVVSLGSQTQQYTYTKSGTYIATIKAYNAGNDFLQQIDIKVTINPCAMPVNPNIHFY